MEQNGACQTDLDLFEKESKCLAEMRKLNNGMLQLQYADNLKYNVYGCFLACYRIISWFHFH
jgi:hypothetical protein